jgi:heat shock protein HtpX
VKLASGPSCPQCGEATVQPEAGKPWCPACEWNLAVYDPVLLPPRGWRWLERRGHGLALRLNRSLFAEFARARPARPGWSRARSVLTVISAGFFAATLACVAVGAWLIFHRLPPDGWTILGVVLVIVGVLLRPRLGRRPRRTRRASRAQAPTLFKLIDGVASAAGAPRPDTVALDYSYNARTGRYGLRRRTVLWLGAPLWLTLGPSGRIALLAHELGHQVNGDPNRGLLIQPAVESVRRLARAAGADLTLAHVFDEDRRRLSGSRLVIELTMWIVSRPFLLAYLVLSAIGMRDHQRAEYLADGIATDVAGTEAVVDLLDRLVLTDEIIVLIGYRAETGGPLAWASQIEGLHTRRSGDLRYLRQVTERSASLLDSHPPAGLRARMIESWPHAEARVTVTERASEQIDRELTGWYATAHRLILGSRDFRGRVPSDAAGTPNGRP